MVSSFRALVAGALFVAGASAQSDWFVQSQVRTLYVTRSDPLVEPGQNGPHIHTVVGGSKFDPDCTTQECLQQSKCSSSMIQADKSAYWSPAVLYQHANKTFSAIKSQTRIYYFFKPEGGKKAVVPFPKGLRMLAGPPSDKRPATNPPRGELSYDQRQAMDPRVAAIMWGCAAGAVQGQGNGGSMPGQRPYLPNDAQDGCGVLNAGLFFPSCNDGRLDSPDHFDHMRYPLDGSNGYNCPATHPIKFPTMFMEHFYFPDETQPYRGPNQDNWILSNGDPTGLTFHGDFINGWEDGTLEEIVSQCNAPNAPGDDLQKCPAIAKHVDVDAANKCRSEGRIVYEEVGLMRPISKLPGCNDYWPANQPNKPSCKSSQVAMGQPTDRWENRDLATSIGVFNGPAQEDSTPKQSTSSSAAPTTTTTTAGSSSAPSTTSSASSSTTEGAAAKDATTSATSSSYADDYNYGAPPPAAATTSSSQSSSSATPTSYSGNNNFAASSVADDQNYGAPPPTTSSSAPASTTTATPDDYNFGAPAPAQPAAATTTTSSSSAPAVAAPAPAPTTSSSAPAAVNPPPSTPTSSSSVSKGINPPKPTPQQAGVVGPGKKPPTCRPKRKGRKPHGQHRRRSF